MTVVLLNVEWIWTIPLLTLRRMRFFLLVFATGRAYYAKIGCDRVDMGMESTRDSPPVLEFWLRIKARTVRINAGP